MKHARYRAFAAMICLLSAGCKDLSQPLPAGVSDPNEFKTKDGAMAMYRGALQAAQYGFLEYMSVSGTLTDELSSTNMFNPIVSEEHLSAADRRQISNDNDAIQSTVEAYKKLHAMRNNAMQAINALQRYAADISAVQRAELYAMQGYSEVMLAEGFCSGIPLSTVDFESDYTYKPGSSTQEVIRHAIALFDTASALSGDSIRISYLARIGKARALLVLDSVHAAAAVITGIPDNYQYSLPIIELAPGEFLRTFRDLRGVVASGEGGNGLPFITSKDPRSASYAYSKSTFTSDSFYVPRKYSVPTDQLGFVVASGTEARLIEAEAELRTAPTSGRWLTLLNALRNNGTFVTMATGAGIDTIWNAGTGDVAGLRPLHDLTVGSIPAGQSVADARIDLLFTERAYWLFLTSHRQGDLRRLVRSYSREANSIYPTGLFGPYGTVTNVRYGDDVMLSVPKQEQTINPLYHGCISFNA